MLAKDLDLFDFEDDAWKRGDAGRTGVPKICHVYRRGEGEESFSSFFLEEGKVKKVGGGQNERLSKRETCLIIHKFCQRVSVSPPLWWPGRKGRRCRCRSFRRWCDLLGLQIESAPLLAWRSFPNNAAFCL